MNAKAPSLPLETILWRWLLFDSGFSRARAREIILQGAQSNALSLFWQAGPDILAQQLGLSPAEAALMEVARQEQETLAARFGQERARGMHTLRINETGYPAALIHHLPPERRPLLLFLRGELALLDLPLILPLADSDLPPAAADWALETMASLTTEGALALFVARAGFHARAVSAFLAAGQPFALVIPQGLAAYTPPAALQSALHANRVLLISPFQPDWQPPRPQANPLAPHADAFARALAQAWLALTPSNAPPAAGQPCFHWPGLTSCPQCPQAYEDEETLFLQLAEAAEPPPPASVAAPAPAPAPELPPLSPEEILATLAQGGRIPAALAARLRRA